MVFDYHILVASPLGRFTYRVPQAFGDCYVPHRRVLQDHKALGRTDLVHAASHIKKWDAVCLEDFTRNSRPPTVEE